MSAKPGTTKLQAKSRNSKDVQLTASDVKGVVYGKKQESVAIASDRLSLQRIYESLGHSVIFDLNIEGVEKPVPVLLHDLQFEPNTNRIIHFDLFAVTMDQKIKTEVPIHYEGEAPAEADSDKVINKLVEQLEIEALPADLPEYISLDISDLAEIGDLKHVSDIKAPSGVVIVSDPELVVIKIEELVDMAEEEPDEPESAEGDEASEEGESDEKPKEAESSESASE